MEKYRCVNPFSVEKYDDDGFATGKEMKVRNGSVWEKDEEPYRFVGDDDTIRLMNDKYGWLEITEDTFEKHFCKVKEQKNEG